MDIDVGPLDPLEPVLEDVEIAEKAAREIGREYDRRTYVRAVFAAIEGLTGFLRQAALTWIAQGRFEATPAEVAVLREEGYSVSDAGKVIVQARFVGLDASIRFLLRTCFRHFGANVEVYYSKPGWSALKRSLRVRHRLTHPRTASDLMVLTAEVEDARLAFAWAYGTVLRLFADSMQPPEDDPSTERPA